MNDKVKDLGWMMKHTINIEAIRIAQPEENHKM